MDSKSDSYNLEEDDIIYDLNPLIEPLLGIKSSQEIPESA
jgi:hypothetical protein